MANNPVFIPISAVVILAAQCYQWITGQQELIVSAVLIVVALYLLGKYAYSSYHQRKTEKPV